ncbi:hypothetical protein KIPB_009584, partial [Kipferlia bialata]
THSDSTSWSPFWLDALVHMASGIDSGFYSTHFLDLAIRSKNSCTSLLAAVALTALPETPETSVSVRRYLEAGVPCLSVESKSPSCSAMLLVRSVHEVETEEDQSESGKYVHVHAGQAKAASAPVQLMYLTQL